MPKDLSNKQHIKGNLIALFIITTLAFSLASCGESSDGSNPTTPQIISDNIIVELPSSPPLFFKSTARNLGLLHQWDLLDIEQQSDFDLNLYPIVESGFNSSGGIAIGDYNQDGLIDIFITSGNKEASKLYQQQINGTFTDVAEQAGVKLNGIYSGPSFADTDNDGDLDLFVGGMGYTTSKLFINQGDSTFVEGIAPSISKEFTQSSSFGDYNNDGYLDLALSHYGSRLSSDSQHLWVNTSNNLFESTSISSGIINSKLDASYDNRELDYTFTPSFADINNDGLTDLLMASDYFNSVYFLNKDGEHFEEHTENLNIKKNDLHGMGATLADIDNDGDLDWFVTNIILFQKESGSLKYTGNKLFKNNGDGSFTDISYDSNIYNGGWGWASCIADFNNDGLLDIFNTNGWTIKSAVEGKYESHDSDTIKLFLATESGKFTENNIDLGLKNTGQGRAAICFDKDSDGDIDILLSNHDRNTNALIFYENTAKLNNYLTIDLKAKGKNIFAIGARVYLKTQKSTQMREVNINSNFTSQNPSQLHFGLGAMTTVEQINIIWLDGTKQILTNIKANQSLLIEQE
ncbi:CRTAC1 family protein [Paraglaciecola sp.]|uniref:CRTAC1 family protein n=1 Tax=Paraglaciecola sp. TaxID=1920173 RepID=UPI0030F49A31